MVLMSASIAPISAAVCVSSTIQYTAPSKTQERTRNRPANSAADRKLSVLKTLIGRKEFISGPADRLNDIELEAMIHFGAQTADVAFDDAGLRIEMDAPHIFQQHPPREHAIRIAHEVLEQAKLLRQQLDVLAGAHDGALQQIQLDRPQGEVSRQLGRTAWPARQHPLPRQQLRKCEGLDQVVIAACFQSLHAIVDSAHGGEINHGRPHTPLPQPPDELQPIQGRQHAIQDDDLVVLLAGAREAALTVRAMPDDIPLVAKMLAD